jgi:photosystem II stability/assembly factor-like uncharacterized protein
MLRRVLSLTAALSILALAIALLLPSSPAPRQGATFVKPEGRPSDWFWNQRAFPHGDIDPAGYRLALSQAEAKSKEADQLRLSGQKNALLTADWQQAGPDNIGGRVTDLAVHPTDANVCYAAMATGGVFKTIDGGTTWTPIFDRGDVITVGDVTLDPQQPETIYVGTGEANANSYSFFGNGLYRSTDGGASWVHLGLAETLYIPRVVVDPTDSQKLFVAATGRLFGTDANRGVYRSLDGGANWDKVFALTDSTSCTDLMINPDNPQILYAAMWERVRGLTYRTSGGPSSGIWRSVDGGDTWSEMTVGLPTGTNVGRIGITICAQQPDVLYATYADAGGEFYGVYKSTNGGDTWTATSSSAMGGIYSNFGWYFGQIRVDPVNPNNVFVMGVPMYRSTTGGSSWFETGSNIHVDHHALEFCPSQPSRVYGGSDGGLHVSNNSGGTWTKLYDQPTNQFYEIGIDYLQPQRLYGGTQDNGTLRTPDGSVSNWERIFGGDGFVTIIDYTDSDVIYCEYQYGNLNKSTNGGAWFSWAMNGIGSSDRHNWNTPVVMDPVNPQVLYYGSHLLYKSIDGADNWEPISGDLTNGDQGAGFGTITTIAVAPSATSIIYAGTDDGNVWAYRPFGGQWVDITAGLPERWVTEVAVDPTNASIAYATFSGLRWNEPISNVFRTENGGNTWQDIGQDLPEAPVNCIEVDPDYPGILYVGTDVGVYYSLNSGQTWQELGVGLPRAPVLDLAFHQPTRMLAAGTHGRSIFTVTAPDPATPVDDLPAASGLALSAAPNPFNPQTVLSFSLVSEGEVVLEIFDIHGARLARLAEGVFPAGTSRVTWDGKDASGRGLASGTYLARLSTGGTVATTKLLLVR